MFKNNFKYVIKKLKYNFNLKLVGEINHIADFSSLGGVQTYLYSLKKYSPSTFKLYNLNNKVLDIFKEKNGSLNLLIYFHSSLYLRTLKIKLL